MKKNRLYALIAISLVVAVSLVACAKLKEEEAYIYGMESWVYGYPLVMMDVTREVLTAAPAPNAEGTAAPINQLAKMPHYVSPDFKNVVRISLNSLWTTGWVDLEKEPDRALGPRHQGSLLRLLDHEHVDRRLRLGGQAHDRDGSRQLPDRRAELERHGAGGHQADLPFVDAVRVGPRADAGERPRDFAAVNAIQADYKLTPLSAWGKPYTPPTTCRSIARSTSATPPDQVARMDAGTFFNRLAMAMKDNPPYAEDGPALEKLKKLGIEPGKPFDIGKVDPEIAHGLDKAVKEVQIKMAEGVTKMKNVNGWITRTTSAATAPTTTPEPASRTWGSAPTCAKTPSIPRRTWTATATRSTAPTGT